jgi:dethiobiotin synthetase/adenosylmethionine--8-amino-7-oxononanoate aminotransferase
LQPELSRAVAYAAGRYLHVLCPENAHQPALEAATALLSLLGGRWAARVFFSGMGGAAAMGPAGYPGAHLAV